MRKFTRIIIIIILELTFIIASVSAIVFYGPFENLKKTVVGASWNTLNHRFIARIFLSDKQILDILKGSYAQDPTENGEDIQILNFGMGHNGKLEFYDIKGGDFNGKMIIAHDPTRISVGYSANMPKSGETTSAIARKGGAVAAINAGGFTDKGWTGTGGAPMGFIMHQGKVIYNSSGSLNTKQDTIAFTDKGMLIVGRHTINQLIKYNVKEAVSFGPPLVVNGKPTIKNGDGGWGIGPRTAIGQRQDGEVLLLVIDGRGWNSLGATLKDAQQIMLKFGAVNAANLDGGSSTTMYMSGKVINHPSDKLGERTVPTVFMVMPEE